MISPHLTSRNFANAFAALLAASLSTVVQYSASAEVPGNQNFVVLVPIENFVQAPEDITVVHDLTDSDQSFPTQVWSVGSSSQMGMVVDFQILDGFLHSTDNDSRADAEIEIALGDTSGNAAWNIMKAKDRAEADSPALVRIQSDGAGSADVKVSVNFSPPANFTPRAGHYTTVVVATLAVP